MIKLHQLPLLTTYEWSSLRPLCESFPKVHATYGYEGEGGINPAYCDIDTCIPLCPDEKRIWVLRGDGILATGIKNVCVYEGNTSIFDKIEETAHTYLDSKNRYGHPSLAVPDTTYDGSVYLAGWLCERHDHLQIFLQSGRFHNNSLSAVERNILESHVAYKFIQTYRTERVIFYDRIGEETLTLFLAGPFSTERPSRIYTLQSLSTTHLYEQMMERAKYHMYLSIERLLIDSPFPLSGAAQSNLNTLIHSPSFDTLWLRMKQCFDAIIYQNISPTTLGPLKHELKQVFQILLDTDIPFVNKKHILLWSTRFARNQAIAYAQTLPAVTDGIAQDILRRILLGWPDGSLNVLFHAVKNPSPDYPPLSQLFWAAMSELFVEAASPQGEVHLFFQESLTIGNFCWDHELPVARKKEACIHLHRYDPKTHLWERPVLLDSTEADYIPVKRRHVHPLDFPNPMQIEIKDGIVLWKQTFKEDRPDGELTSYAASPMVLTLGKLRSLVKRLSHRHYT